jgi:hypothetical protein
VWVFRAAVGLSVSVRAGLRIGAEIGGIVSSSFPAKFKNDHWTSVMFCSGA